MGLPSPFDYLVSSVSSPFDYLVQQIQTDLDHAADLCEEIRQNRHVGHNPTELNALEKSLREGSSFIRSQEKAAKDSSGADLEGGDGKSSQLLSRLSFYILRPSPYAGAFDRRVQYYN